MQKHSKKYLNNKKQIKEKCSIVDGLDDLIKISSTKDSIDVVFLLDIDPKKSDQIVKGIVAPPSGLGKKITIAVFTDDLDMEDRFKKAGATHVGNEELCEKIKNGEITADIYLASKEIMISKISKMGLASILRSKMPNLKSGTIVDNKDLEKTIQSYQKGQIIFRSNEKLVQSSIGRASFSREGLLLNYNTFKEAVENAKPKTIKTPNYIKKIFISSTMSPSIQIMEEGVKIK